MAHMPFQVLDNIQRGEPLLLDGGSFEVVN